METIIKQDRIALKNLKVAQFASEETLCFTATVLFDGVAIAQARNDGRGGSTFLHALEGKAAQLTEARQFAKGLPAARFEGGITGQDDAPLIIDMTLDFLVDQLAETQHTDRKLRTAFTRDIGNKVLFIKNDRLLFLKGVKLKTIVDRPAYFKALRTRQSLPIIILAELPPAEAFALWKRYALGDHPS
ncbi:hypothetical protein L1889_12415 [Paenalcaligenes niemegkensis]|uniref:hypothetical protein n=1 Tax=Paenalcaligenes niemegkensis TaxID=2895469 RepID=UPI001EE7CE88|nr:MULTISPECIES: hypothetical protein [Alcaligenaceae]MCQ9617397.1 hypothetical protein [Paenalcaligenes niemegkensis]